MKSFLLNLNKRKILFGMILSILFSLVFFYKTVFHGLLPFPGDLLLSEYKPWRTYSYQGYNPGAVPSKAQYFDTLRQMYPWRTLTNTLLQNKQLPLWNPYNFSGAPLFANHQSAILYPLNIVLYGIFSQPVAWTMLVMLQTVLSFFFMYMFTHVSLQFKKVPALLSSLSFSCSLFMSTFLEYNIIGHTVLWLPLAFFAISEFYKKGKSSYLLLLAGSIVHSGLAGHLQLFGYIFLTIVIYTCFRYFEHKTKRREFFTLQLINAVSLGVCAVQLVPTIELILHSARSAHDASVFLSRLLIQPQDVFRFIIPDVFGNPATRNYLTADSYPGKALYIGSISCILAIGAFTVKTTKKHIQFFKYLFLVFIIFAVKQPFTMLLYSFHIPIVSTMSPGNMIIISSFALSILAGYALNFCFNIHWKKPIFLITGAICLAWIFHVFQILPLYKRSLLFSTGLLFLSVTLLFFHKKYMRITSLLILLCLTADLLYFFVKFNPFVPKEFIYPNTDVTQFLTTHTSYERFWGYGSAEIQANFSTQLGLYSPEGYDPLYPKWYGEFIHASTKGKLIDEFDSSTRSDAVISNDSGEFALEQNQTRKKILNTLGVAYIVDRTENTSTENTFPPENFEKVYEANDWAIYKNLQALPRAFLTPTYRTYSSKDEFNNIFFDNDFNPRQILLFKEKPPIDSASFSESGSATIDSYEPNRVILTTSSPIDQLLFLSDTWYPGWKAYIDDEQTTIYKAHHAFRALVIPEGDHTIRFEYKPTSFRTGIYVSVISSLLLLVLLLRINTTTQTNSKLL